MAMWMYWKLSWLQQRANYYLGDMRDRKVRRLGYVDWWLTQLMVWVGKRVGRQWRRDWYCRCAMRGPFNKRPTPLPSNWDSKRDGYAWAICARCGMPIRNCK